MKNMDFLLQKYDVQVPRYTSYPTVPYWETSPTSEQWIASLQNTFGKPQSSWSMYVHIPFCETLCTFCGCNTIITKDHKKETPYVDLLIQEFELYLKNIPEMKSKPLKHLHLGGGTPTFLQAHELQRLVRHLFDNIQINTKNFEASIEVDPRRTSFDQLKILRKEGFNRISLGVQDFNFEVQRLVNRIQPFDITKKITEDSRSLGYESVNFDLIYGLAKQTEKSMEETAKLTLSLRPDRIALYSFALVPWIKPAQRLFKDEDLPSPQEKRNLYELARTILLGDGYVEIGMDHFALPTDSLSEAATNKHLHRNFMGYTNQKTDLLLGIGVSSISETPDCFHQNEKVLPLYEQKILSGKLSTLRGHQLTEEDQHQRQLILDFMTKYEVDLQSSEEIKKAETFLKEMIVDGLVQTKGTKLFITEKGKPFLRNACMYFDHRLRHKSPQTTLFSKSI